MTQALTAERPALGARPALAGVAAAAACVLLASRSAGAWAPAAALLAGAVGLGVPVASGVRASVPVRAGVAAVGLLAVAGVRTLWPVPVPAHAVALAASVVAAVGEELLFRRGMYGLLERAGAAVAVIAPAAIFALVHVPHYGWRSMPVNLGAGALFGWQRWASGSWAVPAATHAGANLMAAL